MRGGSPGHALAYGQTPVFLHWSGSLLDDTRGRTSAQRVDATAGEPAATDDRDRERSPADTDGDAPSSARTQR